MKVAEIQITYRTKPEKKVVITNSKVAYDLILDHWSMDTIELQEESKILLLNAANKVLGVHDLSKGGVSSSILDVKIILGIALKCLASSIILVHNHPSGNMVASDADLKITKKLGVACDIMEMRLLDHLIISKDNYLSLADSGLM
jgi:DNA repair protein RadC